MIYIQSWLCLCGEQDDGSSLRSPAGSGSWSAPQIRLGDNSHAADARVKGSYEIVRTYLMEGTTFLTKLLS